MLYRAYLNLEEKTSLIRLKNEKFTKQTKKNQDIDLYSQLYEELGKKDNLQVRVRHRHEPKIRKEICYSSAS
jgi:hypothetical protein